MAKLRTILNWRLCEAATLLVLASLMTVPAAAQKASDGFRFEQPEFLRTEFVVKVVEHQTAEAVAQAALEAGADIAPSVVGTGRLVRSRVQAWSRLRDSVCEIHIVKATVKYQPELLGHELAHCIYGRWHR